jgi:hypothetical protein
MNRRKFIKNSALASSLCFVPSFVKAFESVATERFGYKRLVIIQLAGGNDGLNTIIPHNNDLYYNMTQNTTKPTSNNCSRSVSKVILSQNRLNCTLERKIKTDFSYSQLVKFKIFTHLLYALIQNS